MQPTLTSADLAIDFLQGEQALRYEQLLHLFLHKKRKKERHLIDSYRVFRKALQKIESFLRNSGHSYELGLDSRGTYWKVSIDVYLILSQEQARNMQVIQALRGEQIDSDGVRLYCEVKDVLPEALIRRYHEQG